MSGAPPPTPTESAPSCSAESSPSSFQNPKMTTRTRLIKRCSWSAAFLTFTQCNVTGPLKEMAKCPLALKKVGCGKGEDEEWDNWARNQLMAAGSDLLGKFSNLQDGIWPHI